MPISSSPSKPPAHSVVRRDQFVFADGLAVTHRPTGQRFWTHPYEHPNDMSEVIGEGLGRNRDFAGNTYDVMAIGSMAFHLLHERLAQR